MAESRRAPIAQALADRYEIKHELGAGGMATVYLAEDLKHKRKVAVKVLRPELAAVLGAERFVQEIQTTANLQHPHILPLFDSGEAGGFLTVKAVHDSLKHLKDGGAMEELAARQATPELLRSVNRTDEFMRLQDEYLKD